ncbi:MAG: hypothetical protein K9N52_00450 [Verrucomicrobia bacterium]|nr:hypothetical protein [Verrucomicrobiota bacterium]
MLEHSRELLMGRCPWCNSPGWFIDNNAVGTNTALIVCAFCLPSRTETLRNMILTINPAYVDNEFRIFLWYTFTSTYAFAIPVMSVVGFGH